MSEHYCPAGKIECENWNKGCEAFIPNQKFILFETVEVCPWPSRQQSIAPESNCQHLLLGDLESYLADNHNTWFNAGIDAAIEAVNHCRCIKKKTFDSDGRPTWGVFILVDDAIAAISALRQEARNEN